MLAHWPIWNKLKLGLGLLALSLAALFLSGIYGLYAYRGLVKGLAARSSELPLANELSQRVADMRVTLSRAAERLEYMPEIGAIDTDDDERTPAGDTQLTFLRWQYDNQFTQFRQTLLRYRQQLDANGPGTGARIGDDARERETLGKIEKLVSGIQTDKFNDAEAWIIAGATRLDQLREKIDTLHQLAAELPTHMHVRLRELAGAARSRYRIAIPVAWATTVIAGLLLAASAQLFRKWIARPLRTLVEGTREVARDGKFDHRIHLETHDEMQELAEAMNEMTARFQETRDDLDRQVREQTRQVVRSEQLASVGFLAAGVAHEINNPLASIALCSESLESRIRELEEQAEAAHLPEREVIHQYLEMIQKEAFRCKQITEKLLDFSRMGDSEKHNADLRELVEGVIEMARLGKYKDKNIVLVKGDPVIAEVNAQEIKQVVLNLVTNGLDSLKPGGTVRVVIRRRQRDAEIVVQDNGCGMTEEVIKHLFEPFFTRRREGQGTGLGLSITFRIVEEHHGQISATSEGVGKGSRFVVTLPLEQPMAGEELPHAA